MNYCSFNKRKLLEKAMKNIIIKVVKRKLLSVIKKKRDYKRKGKK